MLQKNAMDERKIEEIASQLLQAQDKVQPILPISESHPAISIDDAYRIQFCLVVSWLANKLAEFKISLNQGDIIMTGSMTRFILVKKRDSVKVSFHGLGPLEISFKSVIY